MFATLGEADGHVQLNLTSVGAPTWPLRVSCMILHVAKKQAMIDREKQELASLKKIGAVRGDDGVPLKDRHDVGQTRELGS